VLARALAVLLATATLLAGAGPAHADREVVTDPLGDAARETGYTVTSTADLVRSRAVYTDHRFTVTATVDDMTAPRVFVAVRLRTSEGLTFWATATWEEGEQVLSLRTANTRSIDCDALVGDVDPRRDRAEIGVPDFCIGSPEWIRWGIGTRTGRPDRLYGRTDDGRTDGGTDRDPIVLGGRRLRND
jgi:hypothetical protein